jgi:hypothetical protein
MCSVVRSSAAMDVAQSYHQIAKTALPWGAWGWAALALTMARGRRPARHHRLRACSDAFGILGAFGLTS